MANCLFLPFVSFSLYCQHCIISTHCIVSILCSPPPQLSPWDVSLFILCLFFLTYYTCDLTGHIAETEGGVTPRHVSFHYHVLFTLAYSLNKFARVSLYIIFFFGLHFLGGGGGVQKTPLFQSLDGCLTRLNCGVPSQPPSFTVFFLLFISSHSDFSTRLHMLQVTLQLSFGMTGKESPTVGLGHSPQLNPSHLGSITPTLPISLWEFFRVFLSFGEICLY